MAPRWLDGLADVLGATDAPCYVVSEALAERSPASTSTGGRWRPSSGRRSRRWTTCWRSARSVLVLEDIVDHTNVGATSRSGAAFGFDAVLLAPRCADPLYRRSIKVAMGAVFAPPWTRLPDWHDGLADAVGWRGFTTVALTLATTRPPSRRPSPASTGSRWSSARRDTGSRRSGRGPRTGARSSPWRRHRLAQRRAASAVACYVAARGGGCRPVSVGRVTEYHTHPAELALPPHPPDRGAAVRHSRWSTTGCPASRRYPQGAGAHARAGGAARRRARPVGVRALPRLEFTIWADDLWHVNAGFAPMALPYVGGIAPTCTAPSTPRRWRCSPPWARCCSG